MKTFAKILLAGLIVGGASAPALAQASASASADSTVTIIQPITLTKDTDLAFGTIVRPASGSATISVNATTGALTVGSGAASLGSGSGRATYTVGGEAGYTFSITPDASVSMAGTGTAIVVTLTRSAATGTLSGSFPGTGAATFGVGGSFSVDDTQASGAYTGTFSTTVAYN